MSDSTVIQVVQLDIQTINNHPLNQVISGWLRLRGSLIRGTIRRKTSIENGISTTDTYFDIYNNGGIDEVDYVPYFDVPGSGGTVYALRVKSIVYEKNTNLRALGLLLQLTGRCVRELRRVGRFQVRDWEDLNAHTRYFLPDDGDPLNTDEIWLDGFKLDGRTLEILTIV